jgi:hypothetical protein
MAGASSSIGPKNFNGGTMAFLGGLASSSKLRSVSNSKKKFLVLKNGNYLTKIKKRFSWSIESVFGLTTIFEYEIPKNNENIF